MATSDKLQAILNSKENIRQAINNKGVTVDEEVVFADYGEKIDQITSGGGGGIEDIDYLKYEDILSHLAYGTPLTSDTQYEEYILPKTYKLLDKILLGELL